MRDTKLVKLAPKTGITHVLFDEYDEDRQNPVTLKFAKILTEGKMFEVHDVRYLVKAVKQRAGVRIATVRMIRYKIPDTATQFIHKCPAKKGAVEKLDREDVVKIEATGKKLNGRVKMQSYNVKEQACPHCKTVFWKEHLVLPEEVEVDRVMQRGRKKK